MFAQTYFTTGEGMKTMENLEKEELRELYSKKRMPLIELAAKYNYHPWDMLILMREKGIRIRRDDWSKALVLKEKRDVELEKKRQQEMKEKEEREKRLFDKKERMRIIKKYNIPTEIINGKKYVDAMAFNEAMQRETLEKHNQNIDKLSKRFITEGSVILRMMRIFRKVSIEEMATKLSMSVDEIKYVESADFVDRKTYQVYKRALRISERNIDFFYKTINFHTSAKEKNRQIPLAIKEIVKTRDKNQCVKCGRKDFLHYHHIKHYSEGGQHVASNIQLLCIWCHAEEHQEDQSYFLLKSQADKAEGGGYDD